MYIWRWQSDSETTTHTYHRHLSAKCRKEYQVHSFVDSHGDTSSPQLIEWKLQQGENNLPPISITLAWISNQFVVHIKLHYSNTSVPFDVCAVCAWLQLHHWGVTPQDNEWVQSRRTLNPIRQVYTPKSFISNSTDRFQSLTLAATLCYTRRAGLVLNSLVRK